jgi:hypothetical protein
MKKVINKNFEKDIFNKINLYLKSKIILLITLTILLLLLYYSFFILMRFININI